MTLRIRRQLKQHNSRQICSTRPAKAFSKRLRLCKRNGPIKSAIPIGRIRNILIIAIPEVPGHEASRFLQKASTYVVECGCRLPEGDAVRNPDTPISLPRNEFRAQYKYSRTLHPRCASYAPPQLRVISGGMENMGNFWIE
ncbi:hypothetical protein VTL71DRAFT_2960 [Oculimacula yallundae]|uniref:Uncharacterized protein n=1 Tax=Oculimacula yallundae TaxID=86028 RepID=A0ABR4C5T3_9HELO